MSDAKKNIVSPEKKRKGWIIALVVTMVIIVVAVSIFLGVYFGVFYGRGGGIPVQSTDVEGFRRSESFIGTEIFLDNSLTNKVDLKRIFSDVNYANAEFSIEKADGIASIDGNILELNGIEGVIDIKVSVLGETNIFPFNIVEGVNIFDFSELVNTVALRKAVVLQNNIDAEPFDKWYNANDEMKNYKSLVIYKNLYGNAYKIDGTRMTENNPVYTWDTIFTVKGKDVRIINVHILGYDAKNEDGSPVVLDDYADGGTLIKFEGESSSEFPSGSIEYCVLEKGHKIVLIHGADVTLKGNIIREAGDACVSIQTTNMRTSNINMENNILISPQVAGVLFWCMEKQEMRPENYVTLNIKGVLDIYNWKNETTAALMPASEDMAGIINPIIQKTLEGNEYDSELIMQGGHKWIHVGIVVISTGKSPNIPIISGTDSLKFSKRKFPLPSGLKPFVELILKTTDLYGYTTDKEINPEADTAVTQKMFDKIWK